MRLIHHQEQKLDRFPELIELIQSGLPSEDAASTCVVSKSWLHAWSTSPAVRLSCLLKKKQHQRKSIRQISLTLQRHNLPISSLDLKLRVHTNNHSVVRKFIKQAISTSSLKDLRLALLAASFTFPKDIFSNPNLNTLRLELLSPFEDRQRSLHLSRNPPVLCTNLRVLELCHVQISSSVLTRLLSMNKLLEKILLVLPPGLGQIKVNALRFLREFVVSLSTNAFIDILEIHDTPSLRLLEFKAALLMWGDAPPSSFQIHTVRSLTTLDLDNVYMDDAFSKLINSSFPFLEELTLEIKWSSVEILDITSLTLRELSLFFLRVKQNKLQVSAPKLVTYKSNRTPIPLFTTTPPEQIHLSFSLCDLSIHESFFLKMRDTLKLSSKFDIVITGFRFGVSDCFNVDHVKTIIPLPATNVGQLLLQEHTRNDDDNSLLLDAVFSVCHPMCAKTNNALRLKVAKYFLKLILKGRVMENCEIRNPLDGSWVALTSSSLSLLDTTTPDGFYEFKLSWCSP